MNRKRSLSARFNEIVEGAAPSSRFKKGALMAALVASETFQTEFEEEKTKPSQYVALFPALSEYSNLQTEIRSKAAAIHSEPLVEEIRSTMEEEAPGLSKDPPSKIASRKIPTEYPWKKITNAIAHLFSVEINVDSSGDEVNEL